MLRPDKIKSTNGLFGMVGFRQSTLTDYDVVDADNRASSSGEVFQDANPLVTIKNIKETQENPSIIDDQFNLLLKQMQESVILSACNKVINGKSSFIQTQNLYPFEKTFDTTLDVDDKMSCFRVIPNYTVNQISKVTAIELSFDKAVTFYVYLYNSNKPNDYIQRQTVTTVANESVIQSLDWFIADDSTYKGGTFYLGYFEDDLQGAKPIAKNYELSSLKLSTRCYYIEPVKINHTGSVIDVSDYDSQSDTGGINLIVEIYNDYTELIIRNKNLFVEVIKNEMAIKVLNLISTTTRTNIDQQIMSSARIELNGVNDGMMKVVGIESKQSKAIEDLRKMLFYQPRIVKATLR